MAYTLVGGPPTNKSDTNSHDNSYMYPDTGTFAHNGIIKEVQIYGNVAGTIKVKIFSDDGSNYVLERESAVLSFGTGLTTITGLWLPVRKGWIFGQFIATGHQDATAAGEGTGLYIANEVTGTTAKGDWGAVTRVHAFQGKVFTYVGPIGGS